jgi:hypothetical protein
LPNANLRGKLIYLGLSNGITIHQSTPAERKFAYV